MSSTRTQLDALVDKYSPTVAAEFRAARKLVRTHFPRGYELVYDTYNGLGLGYSTVAKGSGVVVSIVAYPKWVTLFFFHGTSLPDPDKMLQGSGRRIRSLRLQPFGLLRTRAVGLLLKHATAPFEPDFALLPRLKTVIKSVSARQRPRRPAARSRSR